MGKNCNCILPMLGATLLPNVGGWILAYSSRDALKTWYTKIKKPSWNPPNYVFGPVWTCLYSSMGYASYLVWKEGGFQGETGSALAIYGTQLALNWAWTPIFFNYHSIKWALVDIIALGGTASLCALKFYSINQTAGLLMLPYLAWLGVATSLNFNIWQNNESDVD